MGKDGKKGLGMGLGALFGEEYPAPQPEREETAPDLLPIEKIEPRADQPRKRFDPEALEMLAESIRTYGLIQPITVRPLDGGFYQIIAGERRWRASRMAGLKEVPVRILTADEQRAMEMAQEAPEATVMVGDQVFTDVVAGNLAGVRTVLVRPQSRRDLWYTQVFRVFELLALRGVSFEGE